MCQCGQDLGPVDTVRQIRTALRKQPKGVKLRVVVTTWEFEETSALLAPWERDRVLLLAEWPHGRAA